jgi:hypothetical protein
MVRADEPHAAMAKHVASSPHWRERDYLVGVNYFAGWWRELPNKYTPGGKDWRPDYPGREALLGEYNEQSTMDREILAAAEHGVDFFQILWYPMDYVGPREPHQEMLDVAVEQFMASPNSSMMRFTIEYCNHDPFHTPDDKWEQTCRFFCRAFKHPGYLRIDGRPVLKIHTADNFLRQCGNDPARVKARLDTLRRIAREKGLKAPLIGAGGDPNGATASLYDFFAMYMNVPQLPVSNEPHAYADLLKLSEDTWLDRSAHRNTMYLPYLPSGWDPRPWGDPRSAFNMPTRSEWTDALGRIKAALDRYPTLGLPDGKGGRRKAFTIYAWNEFGEGGIVAPTKGEGMMKLEAIRDVFGGPAGGGRSR